MDFKEASLKKNIDLSWREEQGAGKENRLCSLYKGKAGLSKTCRELADGYTSSPPEKPFSYVEFWAQLRPSALSVWLLRMTTLFLDC